MYSRPVSGIERVWLAYDQFLPHVIDFIIAGVGKLDVQLWRKAVAKAVKFHPGIRAQFRGYLGRAKWVETDMVPEVREILQQWPAREYDDSIGILDTRLSFKNGCAVEIVLVNDEQEPKIVFRGMHALVDGRGLQLFAEECFRAYRGEALTESICTLTDIDVAETVTRKTEPHAKELYPSPFLCAADEALGARWLRLTLPLCDKPLPRLCLAILAVARSQGIEDIRLALPVDLRRHFKSPVRSTANLTGTVYITVQPGDDVTSIQQKIQQQLDLHEECIFPSGYRWLSWFSLDAIYKIAMTSFRRAHKQNRYTSSAMLSNVGRIALKSYCVAGFDTIWAAMCPPLQEGLPLFALMVGHDNGIEVVLNFPLSIWRGGSVNDVAEKITSAFA